MPFSTQDLFLDPSNAGAFSQKVAYFSMEIAVDQALKTYSGGLGYLAGSHMRSAFDLKQNVIGITILWKHAYYTQERNQDRTMKASFIEHDYTFLTETGILFPVTIHDHPVMVKVLLLHPSVFGTAPIFFLSTDTPENDFLSKTITNRLYDANVATKIAQSIILGVGGGKLLDILNLGINVYHLNEGHGVPLVFHLFSKDKNLENLKKKVVFTTHTPEKAGNEEHEVSLLNEMGFFAGLTLDEVNQIAQPENGILNYTLTALRSSRISNAVSSIHGDVAREMWSSFRGIAPIISITNAQNKKYWTDPLLEKAYQEQDEQSLIQRKKELKSILFQTVADQEGKIFDPSVLTMVWARRFAGYKRANLILWDFQRFLKLINNKEMPVQVIWAGKPYPEDRAGVDLFNYIYYQIKQLPNCAM
ncbi:MAG: alpha-glucan family phosphorylase, partial [Cytophagales bacterium]|nr:alpha-glucan family phosphorylase [Cytophagales bacterium]